MDTSERGKLMAFTKGELMDMYDGWIWRQEREYQRGLTFAVINARSNGADVTFEKLLGREPYPFLRSVKSAPSGRSEEDLRADLADLKEIFADELSGTKKPKKPKEDGDDIRELLREAGMK